MQRLSQYSVGPNDGDELTASGIFVPVDLDILIERVYIPPRSEGWYVDLVRDVMKVFGVETEVEPSNLDQVPPY
jgi:hypothetical protein